MGDFDSFWGKPSAFCFGETIDINPTTSLQFDSDFVVGGNDYYDFTDVKLSKDFSISFEIKDVDNKLLAVFSPPKIPKLPRKIKKMVKKKYFVHYPKRANKVQLAVAYSFNTKKKKWLNGLSFSLVKPP